MVAKSRLCYIILNFIRLAFKYLQSSSILLCVCGFTTLESVLSEQFKVQTQSCERTLCPWGILHLFAPGLEQLVLCSTSQVPALPQGQLLVLLPSASPWLLSLASALPALCCGATGTFRWCCRFEHYICCQRCDRLRTSSGQPLTFRKPFAKVDQRVL